MTYKYTPKNKTELIDIITKEIKLQGLNTVLNCIDVSLIRNITYLFHESNFF